MGKSKSAASSKARDYDKESGKSRTHKKERSKKPAPPPESSSESEVSDTESEVEKDYAIETKDVHRQKVAPARRRKAKAQIDDNNEKQGEEPTEKEETTIAPGLNFLVALSYRQGTSAVQNDNRSFYIPDCYALFSAAYFICELLSANSLVHEFDPAFMSITFYLYTGHLFYYHILRVRDSAGELGREERRCLRHYENVGPAETWPVPTPFIGILQSLGLVSPPSNYYGKIIPTLPTFTNFNANSSLYGINAQDAIMRVPIIPAMQQFVRNFGRDTATFIDGILYPIANATLANDNMFVGLRQSTAAGMAQYLFFNSGWNLPTEMEEGLLNYPHPFKRNLVNRFNIPDIGDTANITGLESFLGFRDGQSKSWMRHLQKNASTVVRFFPGSVNLSTIGTTTQEEFLTPISWTAPAQRVGRDDVWFRGRSLWTYSFKGRVNTEQSGFLYKATASASPNSDFHVRLFPAHIAAAAYSPERTGPYFANPAGTTSVPLPLVETAGQPDPVRNMLPFIDEHLYDNLGGRSRQ